MFHTYDPMILCNNKILFLYYNKSFIADNCPYTYIKKLKYKHKNKTWKIETY